MEYQLAGIRFAPDDWGGYTEETRKTLLAAASDDFDEEPTLVFREPTSGRAQPRAGA